MSLGSLNQAITDLVEGPAKRLEYAFDANVRQLELVRAQKNLILAQTENDAQRYRTAGEPATERFVTALENGQALASLDGRQAWEKARKLNDHFSASHKHGGEDRTETV